ncbi:MAG: tRNA (N(6)-L-threonylcarbamoyladenosine(37)-C(2))-methylthiotransferase MtaB [Lachnospiraceae bacterium]|nr:tRNA (N(6)-L-threonylcarbamoyladenosine(37)-C(2))-methylthiotransferase MtaB [Lachnospiraceae bacterium]
MRTAAFHTLGCKVNTYETEVMKSCLRSAGYEITDFSEPADYYIINTCSVTNIADQKSRQMLHRARKRNPGAVIVAVGCYAQAAGEELLRNGTADILIGNNQKGRLAEMIGAYEQQRDREEGPDFEAAYEDLKHEHHYEPMFLTQTEDRTRAFLKIQDGCDQFCSYCLIPYVRGRARSRDFQNVLDEIRSLTGQGFQEFVLSGIHLSSFGRDLNDMKKPMLGELVLAADKIPGVKRIRLGSLEQGIITREFLDMVSRAESFCPHFHLSLQSGCDETLKRMNRHYTGQEFLDQIALIREYYEHPAITTDVIAGFPGETDEEFGKTLEFVQKAGFAEMHVFKYSRRKGTRADRLPDQVDGNVKHERSQKLMEAGARMQEEFCRYYIGKHTEILTEEILVRDGQVWHTGHNKEYVRCMVREDQSNVLRSGLITGMTDEGILIME